MTTANPAQPSTTDLIMAAAETALPLAGPYGVLADAALTAGLQFWTNFQAQKVAGTLTMADLQAAAAKTSLDLAALAEKVNALPKTQLL